MGSRSACPGAVGLALVGCLALAAAETSDLIVKNLLGKSYNITQLRKQLAYESMAERLAYETKHADRRVPVPDKNHELWKRLEASEGRFKGRWDLENFPVTAGAARADALKVLHSQEVEAFIQRNGFGYNRAPIVDPKPRYWEIQPVDPITVKKQEDKDDNQGSAGVLLPPREAEAYRGLRWPAVPALLTFHDGSLFNFVDPIGFGHIKDRGHVSGFQPHHFRSLPEIAADPKAKVQDRWLINRLELVSLLRYDKPAVYASDDLPRMQDIGKRKTRPLSNFEEFALQSLAKGQDLVAEAKTNRIVMMGSIRAANECLKCHDVKRGDLLGSFSYELRRDPPLQVNDASRGED
jgi:hypothetical protein